MNFDVRNEHEMKYTKEIPDYLFYKRYKKKIKSKYNLIYHQNTKTMYKQAVLYIQQFV